jgi:hypothetical protein
LWLLAALFFLLSCREELPHVDDGKEPEVPEAVEEDPILQTEVPGAYGVPGGSIVLRDGWQLGILRYGGNRQNLRLVYPARARSITLSGLPRLLRSGMEFQVLYRETEQGYTRVCLPYKLRVIQVKDGKVWLKESDQTFFVLEQ